MAAFLLHTDGRSEKVKPKNGKLKQKEYNAQATATMSDLLRRGDFIVGKALYCLREMFK